MFHLAVVLEEGHVVGGGLDTQHATELSYILIEELPKRC